MIAQEHVLDQLPAYALGSLDEAETRQVVQHLDSCPICRAELLTYQMVTDQLGFGAPQIEPPPSLKQKVMQIAGPARVAVQPEIRKPGLVEVFRSLLTPWRLAGAVLVIALIASNLILWQQVQGLRTVSNPTAFQSVALAGTSADPQAHGVMIISSSGQYGTLVVENLSPLDTNHQYQLWLMQDGKRTNGGVFSVSDDGYTSMLVYSPKALNSYSGFGITIEPFGGSSQPTGEKVLGGQ